MTQKIMLIWVGSCCGINNFINQMKFKEQSIRPAPGGTGEPFVPKMNLAIYVDNVVLGQHHNPGSWQVLATISFIANILLGVLMGHIIFGNKSKSEKTKLLFIWGIGMLIAGIIWGLFFPVIRSLWTSSFVLVT